MSMTGREKEALVTSLALAQAAAADPATASAVAPQLVTELARAQLGAARQSSAAYLFTLPIFPAQVTVSSGVVTPIAQTTFQWPENWKVIGVKGMVNEGPTLLSHVFLTLLDQRGQTKFYSSGANGSAANGAVSLAVLMGSAYNPDNFFPVEWYVTQNLQWQYSVTSHDTTGSAVYTPEIVFLCEPWNPATDPAPVQSR
jgi:hypothetical protein